MGPGLFDTDNASVWEGLDGALRADTVVPSTIEEGSEFIVTDTCDN